jgi:alcohol dehydrogenase (cytochrome c)
MAFYERYLGGCAALAVAALFTASPTHAQDAAALNAEAAQKDWPTYHGTYKSYHYSGLDQINTGNVKNLEVAWMHFPERATRGLQSTPLAIDGVLYYSGSYSRVYALDGATGRTIWAFAPELDEELVAKQTHSPYNRGIAIGQGNLYVGTVDGRLIALDLKTGKQVWDTKLLDSKKMTVGFTGAPLVVKDMVIIGAQGGEWPHRGPIFGVDGKTGQKKWEFFTVGGPAAAAAGCPEPMTRKAIRCGGAPPTRRRSTTGQARTGRRAGRGRATIFTRHRSSRSIPITASSNSTIRSCRTMRGTSTLPSANSS